MITTTMTPRCLRRYEDLCTQMKLHFLSAFLDGNITFNEKIYFSLSYSKEIIALSIAPTFVLLKMEY
jgi:hypothetical protein